MSTDYEINTKEGDKKKWPNLDNVTFAVRKPVIDYMNRLIKGRDDIIIRDGCKISPVLF